MASLTSVRIESISERLSASEFFTAIASCISLQVLFIEDVDGFDDLSPEQLGDAGRENPTPVISLIQLEEFHIESTSSGFLDHFLMRLCAPDLITLEVSDDDEADPLLGGTIFGHLTRSHDGKSSLLHGALTNFHQEDANISLFLEGAPRLRVKEDVLEITIDHDPDTPLDLGALEVLNLCEDIPLHLEMTGAAWNVLISQAPSLKFHPGIQTLATDLPLAGLLLVLSDLTSPHRFVNPKSGRAEWICPRLENLYIREFHGWSQSELPPVEVALKLLVRERQRDATGGLAAISSVRAFGPETIFGFLNAATYSLESSTFVLSSGFKLRGEGGGNIWSSLDADASDDDEEDWEDEE